MYVRGRGHINGPHECCAWCHGPHHYDIFYSDRHDQGGTLEGVTMLSSEGWITCTYYAPASPEAPPADYDPQAICYLMGWTTTTPPVTALTCERVPQTAHLEQDPPT